MTVQRYFCDIFLCISVTNKKFVSSTAPINIDISVDELLNMWNGQ